MYKEDLALKNLQWLICHKTKPNQTKQNNIYLTYMYKKDLALNNPQWLICHKTRLDQTYIMEIWEYEVIKYLPSLIDFDSISTCLGLFYISKLSNHIYCSFIFTFFVSLFFERVFFGTQCCLIWIISSLIYLLYRWAILVKEWQWYYLTYCSWRDIPLQL